MLTFLIYWVIFISVTYGTECKVDLARKIRRHIIMAGGNCNTLCSLLNVSVIGQNILNSLLSLWLLNILSVSKTFYICFIYIKFAYFHVLDFLISFVNKTLCGSTRDWQYTVFQKNQAPKLLAVTLSNLNRF